MCFRNLLVNGTCALPGNAESRAAVPLGETLISYYLVISYPENMEVVVLQACAAFFSHAQAKHHNGNTYCVIILVQDMYCVYMWVCVAGRGGTL